MPLSSQEYTGKGSPGKTAQRKSCRCPWTVALLRVCWCTPFLRGVPAAPQWTGEPFRGSSILPRKSTNAHCPPWRTFSALAASILKDPSHPGNYLFELLPSGRQFRSIKSRTNRLKDSFYPRAMNAAKH